MSRFFLDHSNNHHDDQNESNHHNNHHNGSNHHHNENNGCNHHNESNGSFPLETPNISNSLNTSNASNASNTSNTSNGSGSSDASHDSFYCNGRNLLHANFYHHLHSPRPAEILSRYHYPPTFYGQWPVNVYAHRPPRQRNQTAAVPPPGSCEFDTSIFVGLQQQQKMRQRNLTDSGFFSGKDRDLSLSSMEEQEQVNNQSINCCFSTKKTRV